MVALLMVVACASGDAPATTSPVQEGVEDTVDIRVGDTELTVWVADTPQERSQGLRGVADLPEGIDGMLFTWESPTTPTFGMRDTLIPLDIWWFGPDGSLLGITEMDTCPGGDCVAHAAPGPVSSALETPRDVYEFEPGSLLTTS